MNDDDPTALRRSSRRWLTRGVILAVVLVGGAEVLKRIQRALIFPRSVARATNENLLESEPAVERWWREIPGGRVEAWFVPGEGVSAESPGPLVLFAHGNGEVIDQWLLPFRQYRRWGVSVLLMEYRGYGRSAGSPSEVGITEDFAEFYARAIARPEVDPSRVVLHGRSLGGGAIMTLATRTEVRAVVLESTFMSIPDVVAWAPRVLFFDRFDTKRTLAGLERPVLLFHGIHDEIIPFHHAEGNLAVAHDAELVRYECGHNDLPQDARYWDSIASLLERAAILSR